MCHRDEGFTERILILKWLFILELVVVATACSSLSPRPVTETVTLARPSMLATSVEDMKVFKALEPVVPPDGPLVIGGTASIWVGPFPLDGAFIYQSDPKCTSNGVGAYFPDLQTAVCMRSKAVEYLIREVGTKRITPGFKFKACDWAWNSPSSWQKCIEVELGTKMPEIRFGTSAFFVQGSIQGVPWEGCAAGVAYDKYIRVWLTTEGSRVYRLVSWETSNSDLAYILDLYTSADGPITSAATTYAAQACNVY